MDTTARTCAPTPRTRASETHVDIPLQPLSQDNAQDDSPDYNTTAESACMTLDSISSGQPSQDWQKELLFNLFLHSENDRDLSHIIDKAGASADADVDSVALDKNSEPNMGTGRPSRSPIISPSIMDDLIPIPSALQHILPGLNSLEPCEYIDLNVPSGSSRAGYASSSLFEMKESVVTKFNASTSIPRMKNKNSFIAQKTKHTTSACTTSQDKYSSSGIQTWPKLTSRSTLGLPAYERPEFDLASKYQPFSLLYNECSLAAISNWASRGGKNSAQEQNTANSRTFHQPVASPMLRRCTHCSCWGHYDTECSNLQEKDVIQLANSTRIQQTLCQFVQEENSKRRNVRNPKKTLDNTSILQLSKDGVGLAQSEKRGGRSCIAGIGSIGGVAQEDEHEEGYLIRTNACEICNSGFNSEELLLCDGCDCLFHVQCLDPPLACIPEGDWFCNKCEAYDSDVSSIVEIEGCDGFVIEQRRRSGNEQELLIEEQKRGIGFSNEAWLDVIGVVPRDDLPKIDAIMVDEAVPEQSDGEQSDAVQMLEVPDLSLGELCWAKRGAAQLGKLGRDDWWPAMVISVDTSRKMLSPYVVKFFSIMGAGRVRPTEILPFFQNYEEIGHARLFDKGMQGYEVYRNALNAAVAEAGFKSLAQVLNRAREMKGIVSTSSTSSYAKLNGNELLKSAKRARPEEWDGAHSTVVDGIEILEKAARGDGAAAAGIGYHDTDTDKQYSQEKNQPLSRDIVNASVNNANATVKKRKVDEVDASPIEEEEDGAPTELSAEQFIGGIVAWIGTARENSTSVIPKLNVGVGCSFDDKSGRLLVRTLNGLDDIFVPKAKARARKTRASRNREDEEVLEPRLELYSIKLGATFWVPIESLVLVDAAPRTIKMTIVAPPGKLGIRLGAKKMGAKGTVISRVRPSSSLADKVSPGDRIIAIDGEDVSRMTVSELTEFIKDSAERERRLLTVSSGGASAVRRMTAKKFCQESLIASLQAARNDILQLQQVASARKEEEMVELHCPAIIINPSSVDGTVNGTSSPQLNACPLVDSSRSDAVIVQVSPGKDGEIHLGDGIYQAECILDEKRNCNKTEYLVKWRGTNENTWEPETNILNQNLVNIFLASRALSFLRETEEAKDETSLTFRIIRALEKGERLLKKTIHNPSSPGRKSRICPFCGQHFKDGTSFGGHCNKHSSEANYKVIRETSKILERTWLE